MTKAVQLPLLGFGRHSHGWPLLGVSIPVEPVSSPRPRGRVVELAGEEPYVQIYHETWYESWLRTTAMLLREWYTDGQPGREPLSCPVVAQVIAVFARPKEKKHVTVDGHRVPFEWSDGRMWQLGTEDIDNIVKSVLDATVAARVLRDDRLVVLDGGSHKVWAADGEEPHVELRIWNAPSYDEFKYAQR
jgi:Holliday junction resolvase RusA-like endonuclease